MRCTSPRTVGFKADGKTISWSPRQRSKEFAEFQLPCGKCIECRLDYARQWAVRCVHEAQMHEKNSFITLTYDDEHLGDGRLHYEDFQKFMKRLRKTQNDPIGVFVTGEYGEKTKRPHWHAILFNWRPSDLKHKYTNDGGDQVFTSENLERLWPQGNSELGSVTFKSAGYCARYAAKKLVHGYDDSHEFHPISKKSSKHAIGKTWLEKYWQDVFLHGSLILSDGTSIGVPRYYEKWLKQHKPQEWLAYVTQTKQDKILAASEREQRDKTDRDLANLERRLRASETGRIFTPVIDRNTQQKEITKSKFQRLQNFLKL